MDKNVKIRNILDIERSVDDNLINYLVVLFELSRKKEIITNLDLMRYFGYSNINIPAKYFRRNLQYIKDLISINKNKVSYEYTLTD